MESKPTEIPPAHQCVATLWLQDAGFSKDQFEVDAKGDAIINGKHKLSLADVLMQATFGDGHSAYVAAAKAIAAL